MTLVACCLLYPVLVGTTSGTFPREAPLCVIIAGTMNFIAVQLRAMQKHIIELQQQLDERD